MSLVLDTRVAQAVDLLRAGRPVLVYDADGREEETDLLLLAEHATPLAVRSLRRDAGGLVFLAVAPEVGLRFGLPFVQDVYAHAAPAFPALRALQAGRLPYDARSSFSVAVNHRDTFTGITDHDRALTIRRFGELAQETAGLRAEEAMARLGAEFRAPGHVAVCVASAPLFEARRGHTELAVALARMAGGSGVAVGAEMLDTGRALPRRDAQAWADAEGTVLLEGREVEEAWATFIKAARDGRA